MLSVIVLFTFCNTQNKTKVNTFKKKAQNGFWLKEGLSYEVIFQAGDTLLAPNGKLVPAKKNLDLNVLVDGALFVSHETATKHDDLGDGGGMTKVIFDKDGKVMERIATDFSAVNGTWQNCGGTLGPDGMIYTCEEFPMGNNHALHRDGTFIRDTNKIGDYPRYLDYGWVVQVDPRTNKAVQKMYGMGRYSHEDLYFLKDQKTVFITDDYYPAVVFKFVADVNNDFSKGSLFALQLDGQKGSWIALPNDRAALNDARNVAISLGATIFVRHEWITSDGNNLYINETGYSEFEVNEYIKMGGTIPYYLKVKNGKIQYPDGAVLKYNIATNQIEVMIEGGTQESLFLKNPDCNEFYQKGANGYLFICEDRSSENLNVSNRVLMYNINTKKMEHILTVPRGAEASGLIFDEEGTMYINMQHPSPDNDAPFNKGTTMKIKGLFD